MITLNLKHQGQEIKQDETLSHPDTAANSPASISTAAIVNVAALHQGPKVA